MTYERYYNECEYCGENSGKYPLCKECYNLSQDETIILNDNGEWVLNPRKGNEHKFYDESKNYFLKPELLTIQEMRFFNIIRKCLNKKYVTIPQVNLQSIIGTDTYTRNDELFRNVDFMLFHAKEYKPFLAIEINGSQHYSNEYWKERDKSVKAILNDAKLPLLTINLKYLKNIQDKSIKKLINKVIKYTTQNPNNLDLTWLEKEIEEINQ